VRGSRSRHEARRSRSRGERNERTNVALGGTVEPAEAPPLVRTLALAAVHAVGADLAGVDLLPTRNGFLVLEVNGAVDFRPLYAPGRDVFADAVDALIGVIMQQPRELAALT
jgi:glutathione synthase/RimK-type ligase-like ATP-grasp enzyme